MIISDILTIINLFFLGLLSGEEFVIFYGVRTPLASLDERPQTLLRQALIRRLRILVPSIFVLTIISAIAVTALDGFGQTFVFHCAGLLALLAWILVTLPGTAKINATILEWDPNALPKNWRELVSRWERFASARPWAAMIAFALFLTAMVL